jgi:hypothetical protein
VSLEIYFKMNHIPGYKFEPCGSAAGDANIKAARVRKLILIMCVLSYLRNAYGLVVNKGFIASARLYPTMQYTLALP